MIVPQRDARGHRLTLLKDDVLCPFLQHAHRGDTIEIELELMICEEQAKRTMKDFWYEWDSEDH